jgi:hypothetical protein
MIGDALRWIERGFAVFPLRPRDKIPIGALAPNGFKNASAASIYGRKAARNETRKACNSCPSSCLASAVKTRCSSTAG